MSSVTNILFDQGWSNGSIAAQYINRNATVIDHLTRNLPVHRALTAEEQAAFNLNISLYNENITALVFNGGGGLDFWHLAPAILGVFNSTSYTAPVLCTYAVNGAYGFYPRLLYYILLAFSLIFRRHIWLSTAALGTAMTYAATAAAHSFALFYDFNFSTSLSPHDPIDWGDADIFAIFPIVVAGCIMLTPILNWSITVRENDARPVVAWWGLLMFASAMGCLSVLYTKDPTPVTYGSTAICQQNGVPDCVSGTTWGGDEEYLANRTYYEDCECIDLCGTIRIDVPMRSNQQLSSWLVSEETTMLVKYKSHRTRYINSLALILVIFQGILGSVESRWTQAEVRNWIFRKLTRSKWHDRLYKASGEGLRLSKNASSSTKVYWAVTTFFTTPFLAIRDWFDRSSQRRPWLKHFYHWYVQLFKDLQFVIGKWMSAAVYLFSVFMAIACPMLFISSIVINEIYVRFYPVSEQNDAVGQWGPWVSAVFIMIAAVIIRVTPAFWHVIGRGYAHVVRFVRLMRGSQMPDLKGEANSDDEDSLRGALIVFLKLCILPYTHAHESTINAYVRAVNEFKEFVEWWRDPELHSTWDWVGKDIKWWEDMIEPGEYFKSWDTDVQDLKYLQGSSKPLKDVSGVKHASASDLDPSFQNAAAEEGAVTNKPPFKASTFRSLRSPRKHASVDLGRSSTWDERQNVEMEDMSLLQGDVARDDDDQRNRRLA